MTTADHYLADWGEYFAAQLVKAGADTLRFQLPATESNFLRASFSGISNGSGVTEIAAHLAWLVMGLYAREPAQHHIDLAKAVIAAAKADVKEADNWKVATSLAERLSFHADALETRLGWKPPGFSGMWVVDKDGNETFDDGLAIVAKYLDDIGATPRANAYREHPDPWDAWIRPKGPNQVPNAPTRSPVLWSLARAVWEQEVGPALAKEAQERDRASKVPTTSIPLFLARSFAPIPREAGGRTLGVGLRGELSSVGWEQGSLTAPAAAQMMLGPAAIDVAERDALKALPLVVEYLARLARTGWLRGEPRFDYVPLWTGRDSLRETFGAELTAADIEAALDYLEGHSVAGFPCVAGVNVETSGDRAGRPRSSLIVHVGLPLTPMGLERIFGRGGREVPSELRWYAPVLNPRRTPLVGNRRTAALQRSAYTLGLGCILTDLREPYLERGGITQSELLKGLRAVGLYHRQHHSLADEVLGAWTGQAKPDHPTLPGFAPGRVFVETAERSGIWRLSDDLADVHAMIIGAGELSRDGRENRKKWAKRQPRRPNHRRIT